VVQVEMARRGLGKPREGEHGAGGQGAQSAVSTSAPGASTTLAATVHTHWAQSNSAWASTVFTASSCRSGG
jgi:hypothetical protein